MTISNFTKDKSNVALSHGELSWGPSIKELQVKGVGASKLIEFCLGVEGKGQLILKCIFGAFKSTKK